MLFSDKIAILNSNRYESKRWRYRLRKNFVDVRLSSRQSCAFQLTGLSRAVYLKNASSNSLPQFYLLIIMKIIEKLLHVILFDNIITSVTVINPTLYTQFAVYGMFRFLYISFPLSASLSLSLFSFSFSQYIFLLT